ncbi:MULTISPECIES: hypothetical protein [Brevibacillus]|jgi:hypothetical protein|uniref:Uncharacterized protein n=1 Tax=Brevibacillus parabrevis TaxID=54914 RepID=A0A4Y3PLS4_BREPA|nr:MULTISPECIES: hypothetical protein [Brevibacillus]TGV31189.1 hypothetical protein EN829_033940 [Mesorhizobium sp. M00.F.Ca.ET.186.01.1.1]KZE44082.1 hypothetical protein AV540_01920 [Brevibacillus parabrevis]MBU8712498.1 hypothetical protein [Brevibacillus parabrevis]MDH6349575.1 hypothetical protein [Brevibacillus sp. 1238]MDR5002400.1 hypothetical protein [Brevibacillus parabrevis]
MIFFVYYLIFQVVLLLVLLILSKIKDKRLHEDHGEEIPPGFEWTNEVNIDPVSQEKRRVYYNPKTGDRYYRIEK